MNDRQENIHDGAIAMRVTSLDPLSSDVIALTLMPAGARKLCYSEGQFLSLQLPGNVMRSYSMATTRRDDGRVVLHIKLRDEGFFSRMLRDGEVNTGDVIFARGPYGDCIWHDDSPGTDILMLATGTGIAPLNAILESVFRHDECSHNIYLFWGGSDVKELYLHEHFEALTARFSSFHYMPVLTGPFDRPREQTLGVQTVAATLHRDMRKVRAYACGAPGMVADAQRLFLERGLPAERFHFDSFESAIVHDMSSTSTSTSTVTVQARAPDGVRHVLALPEGATLMSALSAATMMRGVCGGQQSCGTCRVQLEPEWFDRVPGSEKTERRLLSVLDTPQPHHRLACQITLTQAMEGLSFDLPPFAGA